METLDSLILLSRSFEKSVAAFVASLSAAYFPIRALSTGVYKTSVILALYLPRGGSETGFESLDRERFTALFTSSISFPEREETHTWSGNNNSPFL